ncbi:MAG: hypothetical protein ACPGQQ_02700 [Candidatus Puniceispirillaceae bacterium]
MKLYSVYDAPSFIERQQGRQLGGCITEANDRAEAIKEAEDFYCQQMVEDCEYGEYDREAILVTYDESTGKETTEKITLSWHAEPDLYDGGRADYYASRGV